MRPPEPSNDSSFELVAVGDISLGDAAQGVGAGVHATFERVQGRNTRYPFEHTPEMFAGASVVFGNLETVISHTGLVRSRASSLEMRGHPAAADRLAEAGFTVLNVANNHMMQHGPAAFADTVGALRRRSIAVVGEADTSDRACIPQSVTVNGVTICFLGFAFEPDKYWHGRLGYAFGPACDMLEQVRRAKQSHDLVICSVHWGVEFVRHPGAAEERLGRQLIDAGADVVLGHHPHVVRRIDRYARGIIVYSLGNFVFDQLWDRWLRTALVLRLRLSRRGVEGFDTNWAWIGDDYQPRLMAGQERRDAIEAFAALDERPEWTSSDEAYAQQYEQLVARNRYESYRHFVRNLGRRPVTYTVQTLLQTARRKAAGVLPSRSAAPSSR
jgi:poly-gamma-glutamate synthesis protein (capsule biosynthesis protein)